ncbi:hypothetical protein BVI2075_200033 [Burkholderia vietnamiensis]|nr:hypothetical protein BVI2075_200033 [Burkholderia vietnamiensis]
MDQGQHEEAGGRLHRGRHGASGQAHGPRRRADLGRCGHGRSEAGNHGSVWHHRHAQPVGNGPSAQEGAVSSAWFVLQETPAQPAFFVMLAKLICKPGRMRTACADDQPGRPSGGRHPAPAATHA